MSDTDTGDTDQLICPVCGRGADHRQIDGTQYHPADPVESICPADDGYCYVHTDTDQ